MTDLAPKYNPNEVEKGRAYHGRRCGILTIESLAQCIGTEIVVVGSIIIGKCQYDTGCHCGERAEIEDTNQHSRHVEGG